MKDLAVEFRQKYAIAGIFLFVFVMVFLVFKAYGTINAREWSILIWVILLFTGLNAIIKSFMQESSGTYLYYYTLIEPIELLVSKIIYNFVLLTLLFLFIIGLMFVFVGFPVKDLSLFSIASLGGILGISAIFTFVSIISATDKGSGTMMSILALPLILPIFLLLLKTTTVSARLISDTSVYDDVMLIYGLDSMLIGLMIFLFPNLWRS